MSRATFVSKVSDYGQDDQGSIPDTGRDLLCIVTPRPTFCVIGTRDYFLEVKQHAL